MAQKPNTQTADKKLRDKWVARIDRSERERKNWHERGKVIVKAYRDETSAASTTTRNKGKYNLFWANVETSRPAVYGRMPVPAVGRRYYDSNAMSRLASTILERVVTVQLATYDFDNVMTQVVKDLYVPGLGQAWVEYQPVLGAPQPKAVEAAEAEEGADDAEDSDTTSTYRPVKYEYARCRYVPWNDYLEGPARFWDEVPWVGKKEYMDHAEVVQLLVNSGMAEAEAEEIASEVKYDGQGMSRDGNGKYIGSEKPEKACIYDIWDKPSGQQLLICKSYDKGPLRVLDDPLQLSNFFPCPRPLMANTTNDSRIPVPDYVMYQHQLAEIDELSERIRVLSRALKLVGVYNGGAKTDLNQLFKQDDNKLLKIDAWAAFAEKGGVRGNMEWLPVKDVADVVVALYQRREVLKKDVAELIGISDIMRGQTNPNETLGAQQLKSQYGGQRISDRQKEVARFARDLIRLKAEIVAEHFSANTIWEACGGAYLPEAFVIPPAPAQLPNQPQLPPPEPVPSPLFTKALAMLKNDQQRTFNVDIETDSTITVDENAEKQRASEFMTAMGSFLPAALKIAESNPAMSSLMGEMTLFAVRRFRVGRTTEQAFEQAIDQMKQQATAAQQNPQPKPDPAMAKVQGQIQVQQQKVQGELSLQQQKDQGELQLKGQKQNADIQLDQQAQASDHSIAVGEAIAKTQEKKLEHTLMSGKILPVEDQ